MFEEAIILVVDDDIVVRELFIEVLGDAFQVITAPSGEACLELIRMQRPDLILMDVKMKGMDGYETCQQLKALTPNSAPVIFVSAADGVQDRLRGYDAGGADYLVKPFEPRELLAKVSSTLMAVHHGQQLNRQVEYASSTAMTAMASMGEMGVLLQSLQRFNACGNLDQLASAVAAGLADYGLEGVVRVRTREDEAVRSTRGDASPLEIAAVNQVAGMGRIVEFRSRMSVSYEQVTLLVSNCPIDDEDRRGRLRDHLAVLAEAAEGRAKAIRGDMLISHAIRQATQALAKLDATQRESRSATSVAIQDMTDQLEKAYMSVALTESQEDHMASIVRRGADRILGLVSDDFDLQQHLTGLIQGLQQASCRAG